VHNANFTRLQVVEDVSDPAYLFSLAGIERVLFVLRAHNLTVVLHLPQAGEVWRQAEHQISAHLSSHRIDLGTSPSRSPGSYYSSPMFLVHPKKGGRQVFRRQLIESDLTASEFTMAHLVRASRLLRNPEELAQHPLLFFGQSSSVSENSTHSNNNIQLRVTKTFGVR
jgi:hypothetical protein